MKFDDPLVKLVYTVVSARISTLIPGVDYEAKHLCSEIWDEPDVVDKHQKIGRVLSWLVKTRHLSLVKSGRTGANHSLYRLA